MRATRGRQEGRAQPGNDSGKFCVTCPLAKILLAVRGSLLYGIAGACLSDLLFSRSKYRATTGGTTLVQNACLQTIP